MFKKIITTCLLFSYFISYAASPPVPSAPSVADKINYVLVDAKSGKVLASQNPDKKHDIASLTKLMAAYVAFKRIEEGLANLNDKVEISEKAYKTGGSRSFIEQDRQISLEVLLKGMIVQSGNDASVAVAEHIAGDEETFVKFMNYYARELEMKNTIFKNSSGLPETDHYSSAYDMALISIALIKEFPVYYRWFGQKKFTHNNITQRNRNTMLFKDKTIDGLKTGFTQAAGYCLAASSKRDDMRLISVVLNANSIRHRVNITKKLLNYGFRFYQTQLLMKNNEILANIPVSYGKQSKISIGSLDDIYITLPRGQFKNIKQTIKASKLIKAPIKKSQQLGTLTLSIKDEIIVKYPLFALASVDKSTGISAWIDKIKNWF